MQMFTLVCGQTPHGVLRIAWVGGRLRRHELDTSVFVLIPSATIVDGKEVKAICRRRFVAASGIPTNSAIGLRMLGTPNGIRHALQGMCLIG